MNKLVLFLCLLFGVAAHAQTTKVIVLTPEEAAAAKSLYAEQAKINQAIIDLQTKLNAKYIPFYTGGWLTTNNLFPGFEFSDDYRFILPGYTNHTTSNCSSLVVPATTHLSDYLVNH